MDAESGSVVSRRSLLRRVGVAGAVAVAVGTEAVAWADDSSSADSGPGGLSDAQLASAAQNQPIVVHLRDADTGELDIFTASSHTRVTNRELAARLVRAVPGN
jgi:hypothetical protein